jgi:hypothetical protein
MHLANDECTSVWSSECSGSELDAYFEELPGDAGAPLDQFAIDLGVRVYDRDWLERIESAEHGSSTVGALVRRTGDGDEMASALGPLTVIPARSVVILYRVEVKHFPTQHRGAPHPLRHLGNIRTPRHLHR